MKFLLAFVCLCVVGSVYGGRGDREAKAGGADLKVLGKSAKISWRKAGKQNIVITIKSFQELNKIRDIVGKGLAGHSFRSFANKEFDFTDSKDAFYQGLKCKTFNFTAWLAGPNATLTVQVYLFDIGGELNIGGETVTIANGTFKFTIKLDGWTFCNGAPECKPGEIGDVIDFKIIVESKEKPKRKPKKDGAGKHNPSSFEMGEGVYFVNPTQVVVDGKTVNMPDGYPNVTTEDSRTVFVYRFPKFKIDLLYDPALTDGDEEKESAAPVSMSASFKVVMATLLAVFMILFA